MLCVFHKLRFPESNKVFFFCKYNWILPLEFEVIALVVFTTALVLDCTTSSERFYATVINTAIQQAVAAKFSSSPIYPPSFEGEDCILMQTCTSATAHSGHQGIKYWEKVDTIDLI